MTTLNPLRSPVPVYPGSGGGGTFSLDALWAAIVRAAQTPSGPQGPRNFAPPESMPRAPFTGAPTSSTGRRMPRVIGGSGPECSTPEGLPRGPADHCGPRGFDIGSILRRQLMAACPPRGGDPCAPEGGAPPSPEGCAPEGPEGCAPEAPEGCAPEDNSEAQKKVFVLGDLKKFGGGTIRKGLEAMLRSTTQADRKGERTHQKISPEDADKVRALLESTDPAVRATLDLKVPKKKSMVISEDGQLLDTIDTRQVVQNESLGVGEHVKHMNDKGMNFDRSAGGQLAVGDTSYEVAGTELHSPIKIALDGKDAQLDGNNGFAIDLNGFKEKGGQTTTSGGLNGNEAWLVRDRDGDGIKKNGVVDGNDVYGDHNGQFKDGYDDLARDFASEVKTDANGKRYIDLTDPNSRAGKELQLLDANGKLRPAKDVLTRIDVDGTAANERDARGNVITARGEVTYTDGHVAQSADQWFSTPAEKAEKARRRRG